MQELQDVKKQTSRNTLLQNNSALKKAPILNIPKGWWNISDGKMHAEIQHFTLMSTSYALHPDAVYVWQHLYVLHASTSILQRASVYCS